MFFDLTLCFLFFFSPCSPVFSLGFPPPLSDREEHQALQRFDSLANSE